MSTVGLEKAENSVLRVSTNGNTVAVSAQSWEIVCSSSAKLKFRSSAHLLLSVTNYFSKLQDLHRQQNVAVDACAVLPEEGSPGDGGWRWGGLWSLYSRRKLGCLPGDGKYLIPNVPEGSCS